MKLLIILCAMIIAQSIGYEPIDTIEPPITLITIDTTTPPHKKSMKYQTHPTRGIEIIKNRIKDNQYIIYKGL